MNDVFILLGIYVQNVTSSISAWTLKLSFQLAFSGAVTGVEWNRSDCRSCPAPNTPMSVTPPPVPRTPSAGQWLHESEWTETQCLSLKVILLQAYLKYKGLEKDRLYYSLLGVSFAFHDSIKKLYFQKSIKKKNKLKKAWNCNLYFLCYFSGFWLFWSAMLYFIKTFRNGWSDIFAKKFCSHFRFQGSFGFYIRYSYFRQIFNGLMKAILACEKVISHSIKTSP